MNRWPAFNLYPLLPLSLRFFFTQVDLETTPPPALTNWKNCYLAFLNLSRLISNRKRTWSCGIITLTSVKSLVLTRHCQGTFSHFSLVLISLMSPVLGISPWSVFSLQFVSNSGFKALKWILILETALGKHIISSFETQNNINFPSILSSLLCQQLERAFNSKHIKECIAKLLYNCSQTHALFQINGKILKDKKNAFYSFALGQWSPVYFSIHNGTQ